MQEVVYHVPKEQYDSKPECILQEYKKRAFSKNIKYIFFSKKLLDDSVINNRNNTFKLTDPRYKYEYVVFLDNDTVKFKNSNMEDIDISKIPTFELKKLKSFLDEQIVSNKNNSLYTDIYQAVDVELRKNNRNANYVEMTEIINNNQ